MATTNDIRKIIIDYKNGELSEKKIHRLIKEFNKRLTKDEFSKGSKKTAALKRLYYSKMKESIAVMNAVNKSDAEILRLLGLQTEKIAERFKFTQLYFGGLQNKSEEEREKEKKIFEIKEAAIKAEQEELENLLEAEKIKSKELHTRFSAIFIDKLAELQFLYEALGSIGRYKFLLSLHRILIFITPYYIKFSYYLFGFWLALRLDIFSEFLKHQGLNDTIIKPLVYLLSLFILDIVVGWLTRILMKTLNIMALRELGIANGKKAGALFYLNLAKEEFPEVNDLFFIKDK